MLEIGARSRYDRRLPPPSPPIPISASWSGGFASVPIRNAGTMGGNVANGSPIGDSMPALIAYGARSCCESAAAARDDRRSRISTSTTAKRDGAGRVRPALRCRCRDPARIRAATSCPSASTRTSPPYAPALP